MSDFLEQMAISSRRRADVLRAGRGEDDLYRRAREADAAPALRLSQQGFDLIAEIKLASPSEGRLAIDAQGIAGRASTYGRSGACAVSVLTEPDFFGGDIRHLETAAVELAVSGIPVLAKDFIIDPCQVCEARIAGAGGILLIIRMLDNGTASEILELSLELGMFVLLEAFDHEDLARAGALIRNRTQKTADQVLVGLNTRDLQSLKVDPDRLMRLAGDFPAGVASVAESGIDNENDAARVAGLGYSLALVGTALMKDPDPGTRIEKMLQAARQVASQTSK
jgi:indole-3-glycerol phosphate synthase